MPYYNPEIHHRTSIRLRGFDYSRPGWYFVTMNLHDIRCVLATPDVNCLRLTELGAIADQYWRGIPMHFAHVELDEFAIMPDHIHGILHLTQPPDAVVRRDGPGADKGENGAGRGVGPGLAVGIGHDAKPDDGYQLTAGVGCGADLDDDRGSTAGVESGGLTVGVDTRGFAVGVDHDQPLPTPIGSSIPPSRIPQPIPTRNDHPVSPDRAGNRRVNRYQHVIPGSISLIIAQFRGSVKRWANKNGFPLFRWQRTFHDHVIRNEEELDRIRRYIRNNPRRWLEGRHDDPGTMEATCIVYSSHERKRPCGRVVPDRKDSTWNQIETAG